jgi:hypothetical protein
MKWTHGYIQKPILLQKNVMEVYYGAKNDTTANCVTISVIDVDSLAENDMEPD